MAKDLVCGMDVVTDNAAAKSTYVGNDYFFCSTNCKQKFDADPAAFVNPASVQFLQQMKRL